MTGIEESGDNQVERRAGPDAVKADFMARKLKQARSKVQIFAGEASAPAYSDPGFIEAAVEAHRENGTTIDVICGPILSVIERDGKRYNGLLELAAKGIVSLYYRSKRTNLPHFFVTDEPALLLEEPHGLHTGHGGGRIIEVPPESVHTEAAKYSERFTRMIQSQSVDGASVRLSQKPEADFISLFGKEIAQLLTMANERGENVDLMDKADVLDRLRALGYPLSGVEVLWSGEISSQAVAESSVAWDAITRGRGAMLEATKLLGKLFIPICLASQVIAIGITGPGETPRAMVIEVLALGSAFTVWSVMHVLRLYTRRS